MIDKNFVKDIELYICEKFGYRNSVYVNPTCNGCCIDIREKDVKLYFRLWEYSKGVNGFPDRCIILVNHAFEKNYQENLLDLVSSSRSTPHSTVSTTSASRMTCEAIIAC